MSPQTDSPSLEDPAEKMNRMYRWTRHVYDLSRRYYLLGRDEMLERIADLPGGTVLELGCGTARNLRMLDEWAPQHTLYGLDASLSMLTTARAKLERAGCTKRVTLGQGLAQDLNPNDQLRTEGPFDVIFFSYVLSMIPSWRAALREALQHLAPNGQLFVVDFWDQAHLPDWTAAALQQWLSWFDVHPRSAVPDALNRMGQADHLTSSVEAVAYRYAYRAHLRRSGPLSAAALDALSPASESTDRPPQGSSESPSRRPSPEGPDPSSHS